MHSDVISPAGFETMSPAMADMVGYPSYLFDLIRPVLGTRIMEIGVGYGNYTRWLLEHGAVLGTDISLECLEVVRKRYPSPQLFLRRMDLNDFDSIQACREFQANSIVCINVLEHIEDDVAALAALKEVSAPDGRLAILVPAHPGLYGEMDRQAGHFRRYTRGSLRESMENAGWTVDSTFYANAVGAIGWWVHNRVRRNVGLHDAAVNAQMRASDRWLPRLCRWADPLTRSFFGLSVLGFAHRAGAAPGTK